MNRFRYLLLATLISSSLISGCANDAQSGDKSAKAEQGEEQKDKKDDVAVPVEVAAVRTGDIAATLTSTTTLEAEEQASVVAKVSGIVTALHVEEGQMVKAGDPLLQLDTDKLKLELARAESNLGKLKQELDRTLMLRDRQLIAADAADKARFEYEAQKAAYDLARLDLHYATVRAPISGVISRRNVKVGNMVQLNQMIFEITDFDPLLAVIHVPEKELPKLQLKQPALIAVDAFRDAPHTAHILRISPVVDAATGTVKVTLALKDDSGRVKPGMFGRVAVTYAQHADTLLVNKEAVLSEDGEQAVFVVRDGKAHRTPVSTGFQNEGQVEILSGVSAGDQIVITGQNSLKHEAKVNVLNAAAAPAPTKAETLATAH